MLAAPSDTKAPPAESYEYEAEMLSEGEEAESVRLNVYDLGVNLEDTVAAIFNKMGYSVETRKRMPTSSGATAEIDILLRRGTRVKAVECKNYDPSRSVGISDLRVFKDKLGDTRIYAGVFVTNTSFSEDSEKLAESTGIELWDGETLREKFFAHAIGRIRNPTLVEDPILPLHTDFSSASRVSLHNSQVIRLFNSVLLYHPYMEVKYRLHVRRSDPTGRSHSVKDEGTYYVDALDGDIINREKTILEGIGGMFKKAEERRQSKEDRFVTEDLKNIASVTKPVLATSEYQVSVADPAIGEKEAIMIVRRHVAYKNTRTVDYTVRKRGEQEIRKLRIVPRLNEVSIRGTKLVYVPKWNLEFEAGQSSFSREMLASSGRVLVDDMAKCGKCSVLRRQSVVVCEVCGKPLCEKHSYQEGGWLCEDHISSALKEEIGRKGLLSRLKLGIGQ